MWIPRIMIAVLVVLMGLSSFEKAQAKPVLRQYVWEDLVVFGRVQQGGAEVFRIHVIADPNKPCDPGAKNKYKVRTVRLAGTAAYDWLVKKGMVVYQGGHWHGTQDFQSWKLSHRARSLYWQACTGATDCGQLVPQPQRENLLRWLQGKKQNQWDRKAVKSYGVYHGLRDQIISANYYSLHYELNVEIWKQRVDCFSGCIMSTPQNIAVNPNAKRYYEECLKRCKDNHPYKKCP